MSTGLRILLFFVLPILGILMFPPETLAGGIVAVPIAIILFGLLGFMVWQGRQWALTLTIFLQGFNVIVRLMIFIAHAVRPANAGGGADIALIITSILAIGISLWVLLRLDRVDVQRTMVR